MSSDRGHSIEKGKNVLYVLKAIAETCDDETIDAPHLRLKIRGLAHLAAADLTKVMANVSETEHDQDDQAKVFSPGEEGMEELLVKYGWMTREATQRHCTNLAARRLFELSQGTRAQSRTLMHEVLAKLPEHDELFWPLSQRLEAVTQGQGDWTAVQHWCETHLKSFAQYS